MNMGFLILNGLSQLTLLIMILLVNKKHKNADVDV